MHKLLKIVESLLSFLVYVGLVIGTILFLLFGIVDITDQSKISLVANHLLVGSVGLLLAATNIFGMFAIRRKHTIKQIAVATIILILSVTFSHISPMRLLALFGGGDPAQLASYWTGVTAMMVFFLVVVQKITGRCE